MRENLIPEQRVDKNGHVKTQWIRVDTRNPASKRKLIPAPAISPSPAINYPAELDKLLVRAATDFFYNVGPFLDHAPKSTLAYVHEALTAKGKPRALDAQVALLMDDRVEPHLMEAFIHLYEMHDTTGKDLTYVEYLRGAIESGSKQSQGYDRNDPERVTAVANLYRFIRDTAALSLSAREPLDTVDNHGNAILVYRLTNRDLADYIIDNPDRFDDVLELALDHPEQLRNRDRSGIEMLMEEKQNWTPVSEGVL